MVCMEYENLFNYSHCRKEGEKSIGIINIFSGLGNKQKYLPFFCNTKYYEVIFTMITNVAGVQFTLSHIQ